ncbi:conserved hypothetical protein [Xylella fastidiosa Temecula1]|jgi:uncharacterized Zn-finger protein|uniref:Zinc finger CHCC-type domain-containing protein n=5 Tax=Xylella fastidiosa TaxID=2371 RepID=Q87F62_XYLFT|nr:conserved hypothetical protein [Xylella fastidiosa Temecula1]ACB91524.1 conserved hypothetical protein [Xylella fastidiosa M23]AIC10969.1 hypothetical protein D934_01330 [Xylella fastidiosa subsp. sandyi Ann-1]AIC14112.1 hypothetical protein P303_11560 [Xylella fastidiosa MUL0034]EWG13934.1 hypothetical protein P910_002858 [Xylella fastidiosa Mul-MD]KAF0570476.1 hypothetical protein P305_09940 [Xylella fastidiosa subsp. fastidiosa Mus-1]SHG57188.1 Uncharacterized conserved protein, contain
MTPSRAFTNRMTAVLTDKMLSHTLSMISPMSQTATAPANAQKRYTVHRRDLPLSCPMPEMALWNSHPRVYLPIEDEPNGEVTCPYCGAVYTLID